MNLLPKSRVKNIVVQNLKDEVLIYDLTTDKAFCLNKTTAKVFNACDGKTTFAELRAKSDLTDEVIYLALDELKKQNLLEDEYLSPFAGMSRRAVIKKVGLASLIALPLISVIVTPQAAQAASRPCSCCVRAGQLICKTCGRTGIIRFAGYNSRNGTCTNADGGIGSIDCSGTDGTDTREVCVL